MVTTNTSTSTEPLLAVENLRVDFLKSKERPVHAVHSMSFTVQSGECVVILGESGSGKSVTAQALLGLHPVDTTNVTAESMRFCGESLIGPGSTLKSIRGQRMSMVFQDALSALNPVQRVGRQIAEMFMVHRKIGKREADRRAVELMKAVQIPDAERRARNYPHEMSGGMRQRIVIAMALALDPQLLIADEPTTALDVTVQAQILTLLTELRREKGMALLLITHDVGVAAEIADRIIVMYAGVLLEEGTAEQILLDPLHPYTRGLLESVPRPDQDVLPTPIAGGLPDPRDELTGCPFAPRCPLAMQRCRTTIPELTYAQDGRAVACHLVESGLQTKEASHA
ncbi:ABC transporter ATP-binding protein [Microbacterium alcoholitolerans]|uniref:ABC transporter ATP-binding protein n=1 Tax=unclassified Microbacterium TaxID=2609290 RepID=UPI000A8ECE1E